MAKREKLRDGKRMDQGLKGFGKRGCVSKRENGEEQGRRIKTEIYRCTNCQA